MSLCMCVQRDLESTDEDQDDKIRPLWQILASSRVHFTEAPNRSCTDMLPESGTCIRIDTATS